jgi:hypothetical protein
MQQKSENVAHAADRIRLQKPKNSVGLWNSPRTGYFHMGARILKHVHKGWGIELRRKAMLLLILVLFIRAHAQRPVLFKNRN